MMRCIESINIYEGLQLGLTVLLWKKKTNNNFMINFDWSYKQKLV